ncbi:MAG: methylated-DNA--[protein]-cysteine S-methyltransferase [Acidobacteria bacterium]|nr:methylated-DNA--[protein]-cysteine S-methyltransferase [Acidobacteriota bacterium]
MENLYWQDWKLPFGKGSVCCSHRGVLEIRYGSAPEKNHGRQQGKEAQIARRAAAEIGEYFAGRRQQFTVPLDLRGTPFQRKVWKALLEIPYGQTRSYREVACQVGNPRAARAVGMANHWNPAPILVPCHRVIASNGTLGGYAGGVSIKSRLLRLEQSVVARERAGFRERQTRQIPRKSIREA